MENLFLKQQKLNDLILANFKKEIGKNVTFKQLIEKDFLALFVEIGEFIEENNPTLKRKEYIDILHVLLSVGNTLGINKSIYKRSLNDIYIQCEGKIYERELICFIKMCSKLVNAHRGFKYWSRHRKSNNLEKHYLRACMAFFSIGKALDYTVEEIKNTYHEKWLENIERQQAGY